METKIIKHKTLGDCLIIQNGDFSIGVPLQFGIRISFLSYKNSDNLFYEQPSSMKKFTTSEGWRLYGGHRLWIAPESNKSYYPDNNPISFVIEDDKIVITQEEDEWLKIKKSIELSFEGENCIKLIHKIQNTDSIERKFSVWPVTTMAGGGIEYIPLDHRARGYTPLQHITWWPSTDLDDDRVKFSKDFITLTHKPNSKTYKLGIGHPNGNVKYVNKGIVFEKSYEIIKDKVYPDSNVSYETYMSDEMIELETLSPLYTVEPNQTVQHIEKWILTKE